MKKMRLLSLALTLVLCLTACGGPVSGSAAASNTPANEGEPTFTMDPAGYPVLPEKKTFSILAATSIPEGPGAWETPNEIPYFINMEEHTNIHFEWETITHTNFAERFSTLLAADDLPDVVLKAYGLSDSELVTQGTNGMFVNIEPYLEEYAPDFYAYCVENDLLKYLRMGGGIWSFPYIFDSESIQMSKIYFNADWLEAVGKEMPVTLDEYLDVFRAFRDNDANGNGDPTDEIPLGLCDSENFINIFAGAYGLMNRGTSNTYIDADPSDSSGNTLRFWRGDDTMKDLLKMYKQYWDEGLISHNLYDADYYILFDNLHHEDKHGAHAAWVTVSGQGMIDKFIAPDAPPIGPAGQTWAYISGKVAQKPGLIITKECGDPAAMVAWANYNYTQQGAYDYFLGIEGESYIIDEEGHTRLTDLIENNPDGMTVDQAILRYSLYPLGHNPSLATDETFKGGETYWTSLEGTERFHAYKPETVWEAVPLSVEQAQVISSCKGDLQAVIAEYEGKFVTGVLDIDKGGEEYQEKLDAAGRQEYLKAYQEAYDAMG